MVMVEVVLAKVVGAVVTIMFAVMARGGDSRGNDGNGNISLSKHFSTLVP